MIEGVTFDWWNTLAMTSPDHDRRLRALRIERLAPALARLPERPRMEALLAAYDRQTEILEAAWGRGVDLRETEQIATILPPAGVGRAAPPPATPAVDGVGGGL